MYECVCVCVSVCMSVCVFVCVSVCVRKGSVCNGTSAYIHLCMLCAAFLLHVYKECMFATG